MSDRYIDLDLSNKVSNTVVNDVNDIFDSLFDEDPDHEWNNSAFISKNATEPAPAVVETKPSFFDILKQETPSSFKESVQQPPVIKNKAFDTALNKWLWSFSNANKNRTLHLGGVVLFSKRK